MPSPPVIRSSQAGTFCLQVIRRSVRNTPVRGSIWRLSVSTAMTWSQLWFCGYQQWSLVMYGDEVVRWSIIPDTWPSGQQKLAPIRTHRYTSLNKTSFSAWSPRAKLALGDEERWIADENKIVSLSSSNFKDKIFLWVLKPLKPARRQWVQFTVETGPAFAKN
jgi:hypothetical protein